MRSIPRFGVNQIPPAFFVIIFCMTDDFDIPKDLVENEDLISVVSSEIPRWLVKCPRQSNHLLSVRYSLH